MKTSSKVPIQKAMENIGNYGCYFLCLIHLSKNSFQNTLDYYNTFIEKGFMEEDCYIKDPVRILNFLGYKCSKVEKTTENGQIAMYKHGTFNHFVVVGNDGYVWDPLGSSNTVKYGHVESYRRFT